MNDVIKYVSEYLGPVVRAENGISETLPETEPEAARTLIKLYEVLKANIQKMELELKGLRDKASFDVQIALAKEIRQRENILYGEMDGLINILREQGKI